MSDTLKGALWMIGTIVSFSLMAVAGREVAGQLDTFEIMFYRSAVGVVIVVALITANGRWRDIRTTRLPLHLLRNACHFIGQNLWFLAVSAVPLAQVFALEFTTPIWVLLLSPLLLSERMTPIRALCAVLGFIGILIVARPGSTEISWPIAAAAACAIFFALTIILTKRLTRTDSVLCILFYLTIVQLVLGAAAAGWDGDIALPRGATALWVILIGLCGLMAHFCYTTALALAPATVVTPIDFARLPTIAIVGWLVYQEALDPYVFLGALVIFAGNYMNILTATRQNQPHNPR